MTDSKIFKVEQMKWNKGKVREVSVPYSNLTGDVDYDLEKVFHYGQNDFQKQGTPSVSMGDIIEWPNGDKYIVKDFGFEKLSDEQYKLFKDSLQESIDGGGIGDDDYRNILYRKLGKDSFKYC